MNRATAALFKFCEVWGSGFVFLFVLSLLGIVSLVVGGAVAWVLFLLFGSKSEVNLEWSALFAVLVAPYIFGRALPDLQDFLKLK